MEKIYKIDKDPYVFNNQYYILAGLILFLVGIYYSLNSSPLWGVIVLIGLLLTILGFVKSMDLRNSFKVRLNGADLVLGDNSQNIPISSIITFAKNYEIRKVNTNFRAPLIAPANYIFSTFQWGYLIKTKDGKITSIPKNLSDFNQFIKDLKTINPSVSEDQSWEASNKSTADAEVQKNNLKEKQWHEKNNNNFFPKH